MVGGLTLRYIDSGSREPAHAVGQWLQTELEAGLAAIRIQSGFYSRNALRPFVPAFEALAQASGLARVVIGSNDGQTLTGHLQELVEALALPREGAELGVVYLSGAYFHPKTYHLVRSDGSETAYVGSANFTLPGIAGKHVEAGILLDTRLGDPVDTLAAISAATDAWFGPVRPGFERVLNDEDVDRLRVLGILSSVPPPRPPRPAGQGGQPPQRPTHNYLLNLAAPHPAVAEPEDMVDEVAEVAALSLPVVQRTPPYPPYMYFAPDADLPTYGAEALTGITLGEARGLIVRLSRDNDRHWREAPGTANLNVPISAATTLRFGVYGVRQRPRAEFELELRYVDDAHHFGVDAAPTGIMSFGFTPGDIGHSDLRLVIPRPPVATLRAQLLSEDLRLPQAGDLALLEWPTPAHPTFRMTVTHPASGLGQSMWQAWQHAAANGQLASRGACWLPTGLSPAW